MVINNVKRTYPTTAHDSCNLRSMTWKLLLANRTFRLQHHKMKETTVFAILRIRNDNLHTISHISQNYVLNCWDKPCLLTSSEEGFGASKSTLPEFISENSTKKQIGGPVCLIFNQVSDLQVEWQIWGMLKTEYKTP